jgi:cell division protein FtsW
MKNNRLDYWIFYTVLGLMAFGIIMVYSASAFYAEKFFHDHLFFLKRQLLWVLLGLLAMIVAYRFPYVKIQGRSWLFILISIVLLCYVIFSHSGRWIELGLFNIQVSDITRLSLVLFFADSLSRKEQYLKSYREGYLPHLFYVLLLAGLIIIQPDFSSAFMVVVIGVALMFISPIPLRYFFTNFIVLIPTAIIVIKFSSYRFERIEAFLKPESDLLGKGYQIVQSLISLGAGGIAGVGFAQSNQKLFFLPEAHTDFIFSIIGEEWGFIGTTIIVILFFILMWRGLCVTKNAPEKYSKYLAFGLTINIVSYALINIMVATHMAPPTGLPLPFISYGGSSMIVSSITVGLLLNISRRVNSIEYKSNYLFTNRAIENLQNRKLRYIR